MKLNKYGDPNPIEKPEPIIKNIKLIDGINFKVEGIKIIATNITSDLVEKNKKIKDISEAFIIDKNALKSNIINIYLNDKIFTNDYITSEYGGNLIRLDLLIDQISINSYDKTIFEWNSLYKKQTAICVSKSIENTLKEPDVIPINKKRRLIHTIYLKTTGY